MSALLTSGKLSREYAFDLEFLLFIGREVPRHVADYHLEFGCKDTNFH